MKLESSEAVDVMRQCKFATRRRFLGMAVAGAVLPVGTGLFTAQAARAQDLPRLSEDDPAAQALGYVHDVADVDEARFPRYEPGQICGNCNLIEGEPEEWRPCQIFPGRLVANEGWCSAWVPLQE